MNGNPDEVNDDILFLLLQMDKMQLARIDVQLSKIDHHVRPWTAKRILAEDYANLLMLNKWSYQIGSSADGDYLFL